MKLSISITLLFVSLGTCQEYCSWGNNQNITRSAYNSNEKILMTDKYSGMSCCCVMGKYCNIINDFCKCEGNEGPVCHNWCVDRRIECLGKNGNQGLLIKEIENGIFNGFLNTMYLRKY